MGYRDPSNFGYSYQPDTDSIEDIDKRLKKVEEGGGGGGTTDYDKLINKPKINDVELEGNKTQDELKIKGSEPKVEGERLIF